ncbi:MAG TPA: Glu/Leu/Phe/Val dehydrogenase dimerization domain-containing protein [Solirubrobacteraceae bacterium]|nr:Glu/Leu/Phe/Val dehydrogenase dimerization domain-containing protein [Solirubrobacteraceae bacterium]
MRRGPRSGCFTIVAVHSTTRGPALGGCRMWHYDDARAAVRDALRLSEAMTYKSAVADLPLGGGKGVIMAPGPAGARPHRRRGRRADALRDFGDAVAALGGSYITAEDVGTSARDMQLIASVTSHVSGLPRRLGGSGDPSPWTALGVQTAIAVCCERVFGTPSLKGRTIAIAGLGNVGGRVAGACAKAGATLLVSDIDERKQALAEGLGARWVEPDAVLAAPVDVFAPCALGGMLDDDSAGRLQAAIVAGAANNQLADDGVAAVLAQRGVLWAPDFVVNAGGIINISVELEPGGYDRRRASRLVRGIGDTLRRVFDDARALGVTPLEAATALARRRLAQAGG